MRVWRLPAAGFGGGGNEGTAICALVFRDALHGGGADLGGGGVCVYAGCRVDVKARAAAQESSVEISKMAEMQHPVSGCVSSPPSIFGL